MPSRPRSWGDRKLAIASLVAGVRQDFDLLQGVPKSDTITVARIIGDLTFMYSPNSTVVDSLSQVDVGIGVSSLQAFNTGGAALPDPSQEDEYPPRGWLYAATQPVFTQAESVGVIVSVARFVFDLGAMRKLDKGVLYLTMEQNNILVGASMRVVGRVRSMCLM